MISRCLLPITYYLLPIAYCLLPITYCLLPIAYCLSYNFEITIDKQITQWYAIGVKKWNSLR